MPTVYCRGKHLRRDRSPDGDMQDLFPRSPFMEKPSYSDCIRANETLLWSSSSTQIRVSAGVASRILKKEVAVHANSTSHACIWGYAHARNGRSCFSSGQRGAAALSASAASACPYAVIDLPGTCSP